MTWPKLSLGFALQILPGVAILAGWQMLILLVPRYEFFLGSPIGIAQSFGVVWENGNLPRDIGATALEAILGFIAGTSFGTFVGLALWGSKRLFHIARPYLVALGSVPVFALGPVLIFWFGTGIWSKVVLAFLSTFVIAVVQAHTGASEADSNLIKLTKSLGGTRFQIFRKIIVPSATIWVLAGIRLNVGMALLGAFIGEFISSRYGLGHLIIVAEGLFDVNQIWVGVICIMGLAIVFHSCTLPIERWASRWKS